MTNRCSYIISIILLIYSSHMFYLDYVGKKELHRLDIIFNESDNNRQKIIENLLLEQNNTCVIQKGFKNNLLEKKGVNKESDEIIENLIEIFDEFLEEFCGEEKIKKI